SPELRSEAELLRQSADRSFGGFIRGSLILGVIYGVATLAILVALGVPFAGVLAVFSGLTMIIPFFGPIIAEIPVLVVTLRGAPARRRSRGKGGTASRTRGAHRGAKQVIATRIGWLALALAASGWGFLWFAISHANVFCGGGPDDCPSFLGEAPRYVAVFGMVVSATAISVAL